MLILTRNWFGVWSGDCKCSVLMSMAVKWVEGVTEVDEAYIDF